MTSRKQSLRLLSDLKIGEWASIESFSQENDDDAHAVLAMMRLGVLPGIVVHVVGLGMGGDPVAFDARGARVAIGKKQAQLIEVELCRPPSTQSGMARAGEAQ